jgi:DNA-binding response OmpR family regulator
MTVRILLAEDDEAVAKSVAAYLSFGNHLVETSHNGLDALQSALAGNFDLLILDWDLPDTTGLEIVRRVRAEGSPVPIIMMTGKSSLVDKESGFSSGVDDYVTKPFAMQELGMRVAALLRRASQTVTVSTQTILSCGPFEIDRQSRTFRKHGTAIHLLPKEFAVMEFFMLHPNKVYSGDELLNRLWLGASDPSPDAVAACIKRLRKKVDDPGSESFLKAVYGVGYKLQLN